MAGPGAPLGHSQQVMPSSGRLPRLDLRDQSSGPHAGAPTSSAGTSPGWWVYVVGDIVGAAIAAVLIILVRGLPQQAEREAAEGGDVPVP